VNAVGRRKETQAGAGFARGRVAKDRKPFRPVGYDVSEAQHDCCGIPRVRASDLGTSEISSSTRADPRVASPRCPRIRGQAAFTA
jgi:hypothetical protein